VLTQVFSVSPEWSAHFLLILARLSAAVVASPLFGARSVPAQAKIGFAVLLSLVVLPLQAQPGAISTNLLVFASLVGSEVLVGLAIGIAITLVFQTVEMAASIVSVQAGFGVAAVIDPLSGAQTGMLEQFYRLLVTLLFFAINGHYLVVRSLLHTFEAGLRGADPCGPRPRAGRTQRAAIERPGRGVPREDRCGAAGAVGLNAPRRRVPQHVPRARARGRQRISGAIDAGRTH
jgi:hypothetical protein